MAKCILTYNEKICAKSLKIFFILIILPILFSIVENCCFKKSFQKTINIIWDRSNIFFKTSKFLGLLKKRFY